MNGLTVTMERKQALSVAAPERYRGLRAAAEHLSLANVDQATCELMNESLARLVQLAYETDAGGFCNIDGATGRILIPLPWGRNGQGKWGLRPQEANILRQVLFDWEQLTGGGGGHPACENSPPSLLRYDRTRKSWFVNLFDFGNYHLAKRWLTQRQVTVGLYRAVRAKLLVRV
jgi:hypothetical protein